MLCRSSIHVFGFVLIVANSWITFAQDCPATDSCPVITTKSGALRGKTVIFNGTSVCAYLGIPFAKPPVGPLRFRRPESVQAWDGVRDACTLAPACNQINGGNLSQSEDCLYLNIWVPQPSEKIRTVMYWIYGGTFIQGSNRDILYQEQALAVTGDVVAVAVNYRLGPMGFLYAGTDEAPGNMGIYDVLLGLRWVNDNIEAFGGNPRDITVFGQSAGAVITGIFSVSPITKGLYRRAIMESGAPMFSAVFDDGPRNLRTTQKTSAYLNCTKNGATVQTNPNQVVNCLRQIPPERIIEANYVVNSPYYYTSPMYGHDDLLPRLPADLVYSGKIKNYELLMGVNKDETLNTLCMAVPQIFGPCGPNATTNSRLRDPKVMRLMKEAISSLPITQLSSLNVLGGIENLVGVLAGDFTIYCSCMYYAERYAKNNNNVFFYYFTHRPSNSPNYPKYGVLHNDELPFVHGLPPREPQDFKPEEIPLSIRMMKRWTSFAKTGNPGEDWPLYMPKHTTRVLDISKEIKNVTMPHVLECNVLRPLYPLLNVIGKAFINLI